MWKLLTNDMYLYLLIHQHELKKVNYSQLAKETGKSRQTLSKYYNVLLQEEVVNEDQDGYIFVSDIFNLTEEELDLIKERIIQYPANYIAYLICKKRKPFSTDPEICDLLGFSVRGLVNYKVDIKQSIDMDNYIYAIVQDHKIMYVGSTANLQSRIEKHCLNRPFLTDRDFIILENCTKLNRFDREAFYRQLFTPEWNAII